MEILYPLQSLSAAARTSHDDSVTVLVNRLLPSNGESSLLAALKPLIEEFDCFPGTLGCAVFRREVGDNVEFSILQRFAGEAAHEAWLHSPSFARWRSAVAPSEPTPDHVHRYSGMEPFFVPAQSPGAPPRWKMGLLLLAAVYPLSLGVSHWLAPALASVSLLAGTLITSVLMVVAMTYVLVPVLTWLFGWWLQPATSGRSS